MKRVLILFLALVMLLGCLAACKRNTNNTDGDDEEEEEFIPLPEADYSDKEYTILYRQGTRYEEEWIGESGSADVISANIALRNQKVENRYKVSLDVDSGRTNPDWNEFWKKVTVTTTDDIYQLVAGKTYEMAGSSVQGYCLNWLNSEQIPVVNLEKEWWDGEFTRAASYKNCSYIATGPLSLTDMYSSACIFFNKKLLNSALGGTSTDDPTADLFALVKDGKWTLDKLIEYAEKCTDEVEGAEGASVYGLSSNTTTLVDAYIYASNLVMTERKKVNGEETIVLKAVDNNNPIIALSNKLKAFYNESGSVKKESGEMVDTFVAGKSVFTTGDLSCAKTIQNDAPDLQYGVIPYPKYTESQKEYHTYKLDYKTGFCIPRTVAEDNREFVGTITEALAYYSNKYVKPALYEKVLTHQNVQDKDSSACVTMILDGGLYEFANIYAYSWGNVQGPAHLLRKVVQNNTNYARQYDAQKETYQFKLDALLESFRGDTVEADSAE